MKKRKLIYVGFTFPQHKAIRGGYDKIQYHLRYDKIINIDRFVEKWRAAGNKKDIFHKAWRKICYHLFGTPVFPAYIFQCYFYSLFHKDSLVHFIYGEDIYCKFTRILQNRVKMVCTIHQPYRICEKRGEDFLKRLSKLYKLILVGNSEIGQFQSLFQNPKDVVFIPHGIDTKFYCPDTTVPQEPLLLTVGGWLRDYALANEVYGKLLERHPNLKIVVVTNTVKKSDFVDDKRISVLSGISDEELRSLYRRCACLFLPLIRYTANNALLEAAATGCNILISSNSQDNSYIPKDYLALCPLDVEKCVLEIEKMLEHPKRNLSLKDYVASHFDWDVIGNQTELIFRNE